MSASLQPNVSPNANPNMAAMNLSANVTNAPATNNTTNNVANNPGSNGKRNNSNGNRPYNNQPANISNTSNTSNASNAQASNEVEYVNISQETNPVNTINNSNLADSTKDTRMNGSRSNYNRNYDSTNRDTTRNRQDFSRDRNTQRVPTVTIKTETINNAQTRIFLEVVKGCFPTRLSDQAVIDGILAVADVDMEKLAQSFKSDFGDPIYIPEPGEDLNVSLAKLQALVQAKQATQNQANQVNQANNGQFTASNNTLPNGNEAAQGQSQGRDLRVTLLSTTYRLLISYQRELRREMYQEVDINAVANKVLTIGNYDARAVVIAIRDYYQGVGKVQVGYSN
ncbi:MAG: hypothetical protein WAQ98_05235 [Blastocatellia bacterium]